MYIILIFLFIFTIGEPIVYADITTGLVGYWNFDKGSGTVAAESSGWSKSGILTNGPTWISGKIGLYAIDFNTADNWINIPHNAKFDFGASSNFTVGFWIKAPAAQTNLANPDNVVVEKWDTTFVPARYPFAIRINNSGHASPGTIYGARYDGTNNPRVTSTVTVNDDNWHFIIFEKSGSNLNLYIDDLETGGTVTDTVTSSANGSNLFFGGRGTSTTDASNAYYKGGLDNVYIYNRALSAADRTELRIFSNWHRNVINSSVLNGVIVN